MILVSIFHYFGQFIQIVGVEEVTIIENYYPKFIA